MEQIIDEEWNVNARNVSSDTHGDKFATTAHYDKLVKEFHPITHLTKDDDSAKSSIKKDIRFRAFSREFYVHIMFHITAFITIKKNNNK